jgi:hypothetical protein
MVGHFLDKPSSDRGSVKKFIFFVQAKALVEFKTDWEEPLVLHSLLGTEAISPWIVGPVRNNSSGVGVHPRK